MNAVQWGAITAGICLGMVSPCRAQDAQSAAAAPPASDDSRTSTLDAAEAEGGEPRRGLTRWNEYEGPYFTMRVGGGFLYDYVAYSQDEESKEQLTLRPTSGLRDFRLLFKGRFPAVPGLSYTLGYMYDAAINDWRFRQTGLMLDVPRLHGNIFVGRTKEGFSTNKLMVGYDGWTSERSAINDALLPILADGVKWTGGTPGGGLVYNLGWFKDTRSENESFNKNDKQFAARAVWLPLPQTGPSVLHLALEARYGEADDGQLRYRSRPESFLAQEYAIDTGLFPAHHSNTIGVEAYYRPGPLMFGMEYFLNQVSSRETGDPLFHGGELFAAWLLTGETRPYNQRGAFFQGIVPARPVFGGGPGAWELVMKGSYADLDSGTIEGGTFWRVTPMVNWYMSGNVRLEFAYGYGQLQRFGLRGGTQFFQVRLQLQL